ncbi:hypothetical protein D3C71_1514450 [compost metagenome]
MLQHHAARADADVFGLSQNPGNEQLRRGAGQLRGIVMFGNPEAVKTQRFGLFCQTQGTRQRIGCRFVHRDRAFIQNADSPGHVVFSFDLTCRHY